MKKVAFVVLFLSSCAAEADFKDWDITTEVSLGYKINPAYVIGDKCDQVVDYSAYSNAPTVVYDITDAIGDILPLQTYKCGGGPVAAIIWPIAFERDFGADVGRVRWGWMHYSNPFVDTRKETHFESIAISATVNWRNLFQTMRNNRAERNAEKSLVDRFQEFRNENGE